MVESRYCPPETQNIVNQLYSNTKNFLNKVWIVGMQEENQHSLQRKQGAGVKRKETGSEGNYGHTYSFLKNYIEVWLIFSVALSSAAQQCDSVIHIKIYFSYSFSCGLSLNIEYSSLCSTAGLCCFSFLCFPNSQSSTHHTLPHDNLMSWRSLLLD